MDAVLDYTSTSLRLDYQLWGTDKVTVLYAKWLQKNLQKNKRPENPGLLRQTKTTY